MRNSAQRGLSTQQAYCCCCCRFKLTAEAFFIPSKSRNWRPSEPVVSKTRFFPLLGSLSLSKPPSGKKEGHDKAFDTLWLVTRSAWLKDLWFTRYEGPRSPRSLQSGLKNGSMAQGKVECSSSSPVTCDFPEDRKSLLRGQF